MDLNALYKDPKFSGSFSGIKRFHEAVKLQDPTISRSEVLKSLRANDAYTLHKPVRRAPLYRRIYTKGVDYIYDIDLVDMSKFSEENDGHKFLITIIDTFSKRAWVFKLKNKSADSIVSVMKPFLETQKPRKMTFDQGSEFVNRKFLNLLKKHKIKHYHVYSDRKGAIIERFNRTFKNKMYRYFTSKGTHRYVDVLQDLVDGYNTSKHRSIKMRPIDVTKRNEHIVRKNLYPAVVKKRKHVKGTFMVGNSVRISPKKATFQRGFDQTHSHEVFQISEIVNSYPITYKLMDYKNEPIQGCFYKNEIQLVDKSDDLWQVEQIISQRKQRGVTEYLVKWFGYPSEANSWVSQQDLFQL